MAARIQQDVRKTLLTCHLVCLEVWLLGVFTTLVKGGGCLPGGAKRWAEGGGGGAGEFILRGLLRVVEHDPLSDNVACCAGNCYARKLENLFRPVAELSARPRINTHKF